MICKRLLGAACCCAWVWWGMWAPLAGQAPAAGAPSAYDGRTVRRITLESDGPITRISPQDLNKLIAIREGEPFSASASRRTVQRVHSSGLFHDVQILAEASGGGEVDLVLRLIRRYTLREIRFEGELEIPQRQLRRAPTLRSARAYESDQLEESTARLKTLYQRHGYFQAAIEPEFELNQELAQLDLTFRVDAGNQALVGEMRLDLEGPLDREQLAGAIQLQPGAPYSEIRQEEDLRRLKDHLALEGYLNALVYVPDGARYRSDANRVDLTFRIVSRQRTPVRVEGLDWPRERLARLPVFQEGSTIDVFLQETRDAILEQLQRQGFFLARVEYPQPGARPPDGTIVFRVERGEKRKLEEIGFAGNRFADEQALRGLLTVQEGGFFNRGRFTSRLAGQDRDRIRSYYQQRGYLDADVQFRLEPSEAGKVQLTFVVVEGERYRVSDVTLRGTSQVDEQLVSGEIQTRPGDPFSPLQVARDRASITALYENRGYRQVELRSQLERLPDHRVAVTYFVVEGEQSFVDEVIVTGRRRTRESVIRREIRLEADRPFSLDEALQTEANLYNLAVFNRVQVQDAPSFEQERKRLAMIQVEEAKRFTLLYGIGYSSFEGPRGTLGITDSNFLGQARSLSLGTRLGARRQRASLTYTVPRMLRWKLPTVFTANADNEEAQTARGIGTTRAIRGRPFDSFTLGGSIQAERRLSRRESLFFRYQVERVQLRVPDSLAAPLEFFREQERLRLSTLGASYLNDSRDNPSDPQGGFFLSADLSAAARFLGSEEQLGRTFLQGQYYRQLRPQLVWATALRIGLLGPYGSTESVPISQRFFSGGAATLRGIPQDLAGPLLRDENGEVVLVDENGNPDPNGRPVPLGGDALLIFNTELRFPIVSIFRGALFYDGGNVFPQLGDFSLNQLEHAVGFGLHLSTPIGPLRFDIGFNPDPPAVRGFRQWNFHLTLGHPF